MTQDRSFLEIASVNIVLFFLLVGVVSWMLTGFLRRYAMARSLLDIPNKRSSHTVPTPRGGGVAIVLTFLFALPLLDMFDLIPAQILWALVGAGTWVALIGFLDDHGHIPAHWRLLSHFVGAVWTLIWLGGLPPLPLLGIVLDLGWLGHILAAVYLAWLLNLYNFMDGIDGIAGIEAITTCLAGIVLYWVVGTVDFVWMIPALLSTSVLGFLFWNFPHAKIFMGDSGSGFIGIVLGVLSIQAAWVTPELFWGWVILLGTFVIDTMVTLVRRILRREKIFEAHRNHAYQYAARKFDSHTKVTLVCAGINLIWLLPIAVLVVMKRVDGVLGIIIAYLPLVILAVYFKAGAKELQDI